MIRSCRIPSVLNRICGDDESDRRVIQTALLVTTDGELLGSTAKTFVGADGTTIESIESLGTLIADIATDYCKLGDEYASLDSNNNSSNNKPTSHLRCLLLELSQGLIGVSACVGLDCMVIVLAAPDAPLGSVEARLRAVAAHVQESLGPLVATEAVPAAYR